MGSLSMHVILEIFWEIFENFPLITVYSRAIFYKQDYIIDGLLQLTSEGEEDVFFAQKMIFLWIFENII